jgi:hypothetical protein
MVEQVELERYQKMPVDRLEEIHASLSTFSAGMADLADALINTDPDSEVNVRGLGLALEDQLRRLKALVDELETEVHRFNSH